MGEVILNKNHAKRLGLTLSPSLFVGLLLGEDNILESIEGFFEAGDIKAGILD